MYKTIPAVFVLATLTGCVIHIPPTFRHNREPIESSVDFAGCQQFQADLPRGSITVQGWDQPQAKMSAKVWSKAYSSEAAKRLAESVQLELKREEDRIILAYTPPLSLVKEEIVSIDVMVHLPESAGATLQSTHADFAVTDLAGAIDLHSGHGDIKLSGSAGPVKCQTRFGDIHLTKANAGVDCQTNHGDLVLMHIHGTVTGRTHFGDITLENVIGPMDCTTYHGNIKLTNAPGPAKGQQIRLSTKFGNIKLRLATSPPS